MKKPNPNNPSSVFFWKDYENDERLRVSSLAAQGMWMRLLCVAVKSDPMGYVLINGSDIGATGAARLCGVTVEEATELLNELERNGVFSRDRRGRMFSRRMVRDAATAKKNRNNGRKGGNPALSASAGQETEKSRSVNPEDNPPVKPPYPYPIPSGTMYPHKDDADDDSAGAKNQPAAPPADATPQTARVQVLAAMGLGPDGIAGPSKFLGGQGDVAELRRWLRLPGLTLDAICDEIAAVMAKRPEGSAPPSTFKYFTGAMQALSAALSAPPLDPSAAPTRSPQGGNRHDSTEQFDRAVRGIAEGLASGTVQLDTASRDPFAVKPC